MSGPVPRSRQQQDPRYQTRPATPIPVGNTESRKKTWLSSASQRLRINSVKSKSEPPKIGRPRISSPIDPSPHLYASPIRATANAPSSIPRLLHTPATPQKSPTDKPLPSLPVATIASSSPIIRRSLIDATEKPLRRSLSPQPGPDQEEDWPTLSPIRTSSRLDQGQERKMVKPSLGESVIEGMRYLNIGNNSTEAQIYSNESQTLKKLLPTGMHAHEAGGKENQPPDGVSTAASPSPMTQSGRIPRKALPPVRHTRTSEMRLRMSNAGMNSSPRSSPTLKHMQNGLHEPGPVRSRSKGRHTATPRGSPYMIPSRSGTDSDPPHDPATGSNKRRFRPSTGSSPDSEEPPRKTEVISYKDDRCRGPDGNRLTSIPFPSRLLRQLPTEEDEAAPVFIRDPSGQRKASLPAAVDSDDGDIDTDANKSAMSLVSANTSLHSRNLASELQQESSLMSFSDMMATMPPIEDKLDSDSEESVKSVRGYDAEGGFKIKKLRSRGKNGATLRISDSAERLLSGALDDQKVYDQTTRKSASKRSSIADMRHPSVIKTKLRRSSSIIKNRLELTRSFTERSLAKLSGVAESDDPSSQDGPTQEVANHDIETTRQYSSSAPDVAMPDAARDERDERESSKAAARSELQSAPDTPTSVNQGDWPLKDFQSLAPTTTAPGNDDTNGATTWRPPPEWAVREASTSTKTYQSSSAPDLAAPCNPSVSELPTPFQQAADESVMSEDDSPALAAPSASGGPTYPPRTSSRLSVSKYGARTDVRNLFLSQDPDVQSRATGYRQRSDGQDTTRLPQPIHTKTVSESFRKLETKFDAIKPAEPEPPQMKSGKKAISTVRGLFHKHSHGSFRARLRRIGGDYKSPTMATPTPAQTNMRKRAIANIRTTVNTAKDNDPKSSSGQSSPTFDPSALEYGEIRAATETALRLLEMARDEGPGRKQDQLVELGKATVHIINSARDAEKAFEQAKMASAKAEIKAMECKKAVTDITPMIEKFLEATV